MHYQSVAIESLRIPCFGLSSRHRINRLNLHGRLSDSQCSSRCSLPLACCGGLELSFPKYHPDSISFANGPVDDSDRLRPVLGHKNLDVATLGNLCVDIVLNVPLLPPPSFDKRKAYLDELSKSPPDKKYWEAGGNCNMAIAAARLGLCCVTIGHVGDESYGDFLLEVLHQEGIRMVGMNEENANTQGLSDDYDTLLCWVLVDPLQRHGFCSRADFKNEPAFSWINKLSTEVEMAIIQSKILFCNGYGFDELSPQLIMSVLDYAVEVGTSVFFDPGPRGKTLAIGSPEEQRALDKLLRMSDVLLLTSEEAESLTGIKNPMQAGKELLRKGVRTRWVIVKMGAKGSILVTMSSTSCAPAFKVDVVDTVGCGDSFVAAIAFGYIHKLHLVETLAIANAVGAATAKGCGAGRNVASLDEVVKLIRESKLNDDDNFWDKLLSDHIGAEDVTLLSNMSVNGGKSHAKQIALQKVALEVLPRLESSRVKSTMPS